MAIVLIQAFNAETTRLIQLYIVGVFVSFNLSQLGMIRHWTRHLKTEQDPAVRRRMYPLADDQRGRPGVHRGGAGDRADHQVPRRRLDHDPGDDHLLRDHARHPPPLRQRQRRARRRRGGQGDAHPGARHRPGRQAAQADAAGAGLRQGDPAQRARGRLRRRRPRGHRPAARRSGTSGTSASRSRCCTRRTASWSSRSSTTPWRSRRPTRAGWSRSTSPSTSSAAGGSSCCTTRPRCGSRAGCSSRPASWSPRCPTSCGPRRSRASARSASWPGSAPATCGAARSRDRSNARADPPVSRHPAPAQGPRPVPGRRALRGGRRAGRARRPLHRPAAATPEARVVFTRHAIPGERVVLEITEGTEGDRFWRGDAVEVLEPSPDRVAAPCPYAGPGRCGGCDFQHVALPRQRELKAAVVREQLARLAHLDVPVVVEPVEGDEDGLRWRDPGAVRRAPEQGRRGMRAHRSRDRDPRRRLPDRPPRRPRAVAGAGPRGGAGPRLRGRRPTGFWQVHPGAPRVLVETVLDAARPAAGGAGPGPLRRGRPVRRVPRRARWGSGAAWSRSRATGPPAGTPATNLGEFGRAVAVEAGAVDQVLATSYDEPFDLVVLDPPREGARRPVVEQVVDRAPRAVAYVACDPAALARDVGVLRRARLRAAHAARLRPVPDDPPRGVRGAARADG